MSENSSFISVTRESALSNSLRKFAIVIDDHVVDKIGNGETRKYSLSPGHHSINVSVDFYKSPALSVQLRPGETLSVECGDNGPQGLGEAFSLSGLGKTLDGITNPGSYLFVQLKNRSEGPKPSGRSESGNQKKPQRARAARDADLKIFLSYRRDDSRAFTGRICDRLTQHFGDEAVFRDVDSIPIGMDFRDKIRETIEQAEVLIAVIGPRWLTTTNAEGNPRLHHPDDYVRLEIESALANGVPVLPVMVDEADVLSSDQLPKTMEKLAYFNALQIPREPFFHAGVSKLIEDLEVLAKAKTKSNNTNEFCTACGATLGAKQKFCTGCGKAV